MCLQAVLTLPQLEPPADLDAARAALENAVTCQRKVRSSHQEAAKTTATAKSALEGTRKRLDKAREVLADAPPEAELATRLAAITLADDGVGRASRQATARQTELTAAEKSRAALVADEQRAWAALNTARDKLVEVVRGAPAVASSQGLAAAW